MKIYTLGFLFKDGKIILAKKKRKIGVGLYNGYGGRVEDHESLFGCLCREIEEECGLVIQEENCNELGYIDFYFNNTNTILKVYIYRVDNFINYPIETEEMGQPKEFDINNLPYNEMMVGDDLFMPFVVASKKFAGGIHFDESGLKVISCDIKENNYAKRN